MRHALHFCRFDTSATPAATPNPSSSLWQTTSLAMSLSVSAPPLTAEETPQLRHAEETAQSYGKALTRNVDQGAGFEEQPEKALRMRALPFCAR